MNTLPPESPANDAVWFYADAASQQQGPVSVETLAGLFAGGQIGAQTLLWKEGLATWQPAHSLPEMAAYLAAPATAAEAAGAAETLAPAGTDATTTWPASQVLPAAHTLPGSAGAGDVVYAGFWRRVAACVIDGIVLGMLAYVILIPVMLLAGFSTGVLVGGVTPGEESSFTLLLLATYPFIYSLQAAYFGWMQSRPAQASIGKLACGIKVTGPNGERISFWRGFCRYFAYLFATFFTFGIGLVLAAFTDKKRALHDMLCKTLVVDKWAYTDRPELQTRGIDTVSKVVLALYGLICLLGAVVAVIAIIALAAEFSVSLPNQA